jgi:RHS repeat-associated protein
MWSGLNSASDNSLISSDFVGNGKWHRIDAVNNGSVITLYLDGQNTGQTLSSGLAIDSFGWYLGAQHYYTGGAEFFLEGSFDEFRFSNSARSADWITTEYSNQSSPSTFYALYPENAVGVVPATANLYAGQSQQFAALGACGASVNWSMPSGAQGTLSTSGFYTAPSSIATQQTVAITATSQGSGEFAGTSIVTLLPAPLSPTLTLAAAAQPPYVTGTSQTFTVTLKNGSGTPISGETVTFTVSGANSNAGGGTTDANGIASYTYTGANSGTDTIQASASISEEQVTSNTVSAVWIVPVQVASSKTVTGEFFLSDGSGTFDTPTSATPAFVQEFPVINFNPPAGTIPGNTSAVDVNSRPFTDVTTDLNGNFTGTIVAQGNGYQAGVGPMWTFQAVFRGTFTVASAGNVVFNFYDDDGFIFGIGNGATRVSGASYNMPAVTPFAQYPVMGADNGPTAPVGNQIIVYFPATGEYPYEVDYSECCGGQLVLTMTSGATNPTGIPPTGSLTITPNSVQPLPIGGQQAFTVFASDASGAPVPNVGVGLEVTGVDNLQLSGTTDATGHATIVYQDMNPGTALVQAVAFISGMVAYSNQVTVPWTLPPSTTTTPIPGNGTMSGSITALPTVTLPNTLSLTGTITDSSGPATPTITIDWSGSEVNGPGTVTFTPPQQTATGSVFNGSTTATFSQTGNYVLQMNASDNVGNSVPGQFLVTVNPVPGTPQGWIGSPVYGSAISGIVPITLASGVTLQSGTLNPQNTLFYYPANNPGKITNIPITAESGTIGTLDTTMLPNGSYWIQLQATDTSGNLEYSLVLVTVTGNYKPGRVTATVTDLIVPANGLAINIQRTYDSLNAGTSGDFGYGWNLGINVNLVVDNAGNVTFTLGGQRKTFYLTPQYGGWLFPYYFVAYTPEPGLYGKLTDSGSSCSAVFDIVVPDGNLWYCLGIGTQFNATGYVYTDPNGTSYTISAAGNLQSIQDRSGNGLTITATGITSTTGLNVPFVRDANNRITQITDPQGNIYQYGYDTSGNLATVTYPATAQSTTCPNTSAPNTSTYTYDSNHLYLSGTDGRCNPLPVTAYYDSANDGGNSALDGRLLSVTDSFNNTTSYAYNLSTTSIINGVSVPNTGVTTITYPPDANGNVGTATMVYDAYGMLLSSTDPLNHTTTNIYDTNHKLISTTDPLGHTTTSTYDSNGNKTSSTYPATATSKNTTSTTVYNQYSEPTSTTDELGNVRTFNYDANYNPQSVTDSIGTLASFLFNPNQTLAAGAIGYDISANPAMASQFTYDPNGNMASRTDALGRTTSYVYNSLGQKTSMVTPTPASPTGGSGSTTSYTYDPFGNLTQTAAPLGRTTSSTYDANGNKTSDTDALGNVTYYQYDALNRLIETDYPSNATTPATKSTKTYDFRNNVVTATDQAGNVTLNAYDLAGRLISVTRGYGSSTPSTTTYEYDNASRKISETDALGNTTNYTYDADSRLTAISGVAGNFQYAYDDAGNRISSTDGNNHTTQFAYDARKRLTKTTYPDTTTVVNTYDGPGNLAGVTDQAGNQVQYTYDAVNQLKTVVQINHPNPSNNTNLYGYDPLGNLTGLTDENIDTTQNLFNVLSEPIQKILPDQKLTETRTYDAAGNLQTLTHFNGVTTTYTYDALNRLLTRSTPGEATVSFTYTATGKYHTSAVGSHTTTYTYDSLDRLIIKVTPQGTLSYTYYANGQVETITSSNTGGASVSYTYDGLNRLSSVVDNNLPGENTTNYTYDPASNVATVVYPNGLTSTFTYDPMNRLTELSMPPIADYKYTLGLTGNRTNATEQSGRSLVWNYDNIYRLTNETISGDPSNNSGNNGSATYQLDPVGNRTSASSTFSGFSPVAGSYNADDQLSSETYDANGNTTLAANGNSYTYDSENHMTSATSNGKTITMAYDAFGNRVAKTVNGVTTWYLVEDDVNPTGLPQVMEEKVGGAVQRVYTYGLQRISQYQFFDNQWAASFYVYDGAGSVRQLADSTGNVTDEYEYDAYGNSFTKQGTTPNVYLYRGEQYDPDLGLYYLRARYYNPATGRFLSRDPEDGVPTDPASLHKYLYAGGNPVNLFDPTGKVDTIESLLTTTVLRTALEIAARRIAWYITKTLTCAALQILIMYETHSPAWAVSPFVAWCWAWASGG